MTTQRATLDLLLLLVIGVLGLLLRPAVSTIPVQAQNSEDNIALRGLLGTANGVYLYAPSGNIYHFGADLTPRDRAFPGEDQQRRSTYTVVHERQ